MKLPIHIVDAFTSRRFGGNPAAVVLLEDYPGDLVLQAIAAENNLSETAFLVHRAGARWDIRWFTPTVEVPLCGHATLASAHVLFARGEAPDGEIAFATRSSGVLVVRREGDAIAMDFPAMPAAPHEDTRLAPLLGVEPAEVRASPSYLMAVLDSAAAVRDLAPDRAAILRLEHSALIVTAPGDQGFDCVSRFFGPAIGVDEDPVTGAAHTMIAPYWAERLGRDTIRAFQASRRGGELQCRVRGERVVLAGRGVQYLAGTIEV